MSDYRLRQGHHAPRNLWEHPTDQPPDSRSGTDVGRVDTPELAAEIVAAVNASRRAADQDDLDALEAALVTAADYIQTQMDARPASQCPRMRATDHAVLLAAIRRAVTTYLDQTDHRETEALATELADERTLHQQTLATLARIRQMHHDDGRGTCAECWHVWPCPTRSETDDTETTEENT